MEVEEEIKSYTIEEAIAEAKRCLKCKKPMCRTGCPIENDIPAFNMALSQGNIGQARDIIAERSNIPAVCGRVCPHESQCEGHCILNNKNNPIHIGKIERFIADFAADYQLKKEKPAPKTRGKVAIIGAGPAGLAAAGDLARGGFDVTVYEAEGEPGGVLLYGIPAFRLPKEIVRREVQAIAALGVNFVCNTKIGESITVPKLLGEQGFDAVMIATGATLSQELDIPGRDLKGVYQSLDMLRKNRLFLDGKISREEIPVQEGDTVVVIGAGNVAMDAARTSVKLGAKSVTVAYRRTIDFMKAAHAEYEGALSDGVVFHWQSPPLEFIGEGGALTGLKVGKPEGEVVLPATKVMIAIGSSPEKTVLNSADNVGRDEKLYIATGEQPYGMTAAEGVFAAGDIVHHPKTVVLAMREGKKVAAGIAGYIDAKKA